MKNRWIALSAAVMAAMFALGACNTVEGVGEDIERGGEKLQNAAESTKQKM